jgi:UDP-N-acetylglucosamine 2-epimerase
LELGKIEMVPLYAYKEYLEAVYHSKFIISDSGTGQEEPALLGTPVIVPRDFTERPQSYENNCSIKLYVENMENTENIEQIFEWLENIYSGSVKIDSSWLGEGNTSKLIIDKIKEFTVNDFSL